MKASLGVRSITFFSRPVRNILRPWTVETTMETRV